MPRLTAIDPSKAEGKAKQLLDDVHSKLGMTPNLMRTLANSPAALDAYLSFSGVLSGGTLSGKLREQIALAVGEANQCEYCVSAHTAIGTMVGLQASELDDSRRAQASNSKTDSALKFARKLVLSRGDVSDHDFQQVRAAGYTEGEVAEIIANVALNIFTNYFNHVAQTEVDFPRVKVHGAKL